MKEIQLKELRRAVNFIDALGCSYKIIAPTGDEFGTLEVKPAAKKRPLRYPYGELVSFYRPQLRLDAAVGDVQEVAFGKYAAEDIRSGVASLLSKEWGRDTYTTSIAENCIEVLRTA